MCTPHDMHYELRVAITCSGSWIRTYLCAQAKTVAVCKACGRVVEHACAVHAPQEVFCGRLVLCTGALGTFRPSLHYKVRLSCYMMASEQASYNPAARQGCSPMDAVGFAAALEALCMNMRL